jgi:hypothetical protein
MLGRFSIDARPRTGGPGGRSCVYRLPGTQNTRTPGRRNNELHAGRDPHTPRTECRRSARRDGPDGRRTDNRGHRARARRAGPARHRHDGLPADGRRRRSAVEIRPGAHRRLARVDGRSAEEPGHGPLQRWLPSADAPHVRELSAGARGGEVAARRAAGGRDRACALDPAARTAADLPGRVRLSGLRAHGRPARPGPLHARSRRSAHRPGPPVRRMARPALPLRPAVHAHELRDRPAGTRRRAVGVQGARRRLEPRRGRADRARRRSPRSQRPLGGGLRRLQPGAAGAGGRRRTQRHACAAAAHAGARAGRGGQPPPARRRGCTGRRRRRQAHRRAGAALPGARLAPQARAPGGGGERGTRAACARGPRGDRLRRARARLSGSGR